MYAEAIKMCTEARTCTLATVDGDRPKNRMLEMWYADESGFYFQTTDLKDITRQLENNKNVEGVFYLPGKGPMDMKMIRVCGEIEILPTDQYEKRVYTDRPWLKEIGDQMAAAGIKGSLFIFRIPAGEIRVFDMSYNCRESQIPVIEFGEKK